MRAIVHLWVLPLSVLLACGPGPVIDDSSPDASEEEVDSGTNDGGENDGGETDGGETDGGDNDGGESDGGERCENCAGCCTAEGECLDGLDANACGSGGDDCSSCDLEDECRAGSCAPPLGPIEGDSCESPLALVPVNGVASRYVSLKTLGDDALSSCGTGADAVFTFEVLDDETRVVLSVTTTEAGVNPVVSLREACALDESELACEVGSGGKSTLTGVLDAGVYFAWVEADRTTSKSLLVEAKFTPTAGDTCEQPASMPFDDDGKATAFIPLGFEDDFALDCLEGTSGADSVHRIRVDSPSDFHASLSRVSGYTVYSSVIALRRTCDGPNIACGRAIDIAGLVPGDYFLLRDSSIYETDGFNIHAKLSPPRPEGATCARAVPISLSGGVGSVMGDLTGATDDVEGTCGGVSGRDKVHSFTIDALQQVSVTATRTSGTGNLSLRLTDVPRCAFGGSIACNAGAKVTVTKLLEAGTYLVVVDSNTVAGYTIDINAIAPAAAESCLNPGSFTFPAGGGTEHVAATMVGGTQESGNNACMGYDMPDHVYRVVTTDPLSNLSVVSKPTSGNNAPGVFLVEACNQIVPMVRNCGLTEATRRMQYTALPAGEWFVWVKAASVAGTPYTLDFTVAPTPDGDTCSNAFQLALSNGAEGGTASVTGDTTGAADDFNACSQISPAFPDKVYEFTIDRPLDLRATLATAAGSKGALTMLRNDSCQTDSTCARQLGDDTRLKVSSLPAGTHRFSVDHQSGGPGPYTLDVELAPHVQGETCANPIPLTLSNGAAGGSARVTGDLRDFIHDNGACYKNGADVFYSFTIDRTLDVRVAVESGEGLGYVYVGVFPSCDASVSCTSLSPGSSNAVRQGSLPPGTYVVAVDAEYAHAEGAFTLDVSLTEPTPGDTCAVAIPLNIAGSGGATTVAGSTAGGFNFHEKDCGTWYPDRVYTFTTTKELNLIASVAPAGVGKSHSLTLRAACDSKSLVCAKAGGTSATVRATDLPAGTYFLFVDKAEFGSPDDYTLNVALGARPAGDRCETALSLGLPTSGAGEVIVQGDTRPFFNDVTTSCGASTAKEGADVLYAFTTQAPMNLRLLVDAKTPGFRPTVSLRKGCGTSDADLRCGWVPTYATDAWTSHEKLPAGTWYVSVDGYDTTHAGAFELVARLSEAKIGESCADPMPVVLSGGNSGAATLSGWFADYFENHPDFWNSSGSDVVFKVTTDKARRLQALVEVSDRLAQPTLSVRKSPCDLKASDLATARPSYDGVACVGADIPAGTSYILVKSPLAKPSGTFNLSVHVDDVAAGDVCADAGR